MTLKEHLDLNHLVVIIKVRKGILPRIQFTSRFRHDAADLGTQIGLVGCHGVFFLIRLFHMLP